MKKLFQKDKKLRKQVVLNELKHFVLNSIIKNLNFLFLTRWKSRSKLIKLIKNKSKVSLTNRCSKTYNKKRFNTLTGYSRHIFLKNIRFGNVTGVKKAIW